MVRTVTLLISGLLLAYAAIAQNIVGYEYWFDQDHAQRIYVVVTPGNVVDLQNAQLNTNGLSLGQHQACLRWKDQPAVGQARWSSVVCRSLEVGQPGPWEIVAVRYWVGSPTDDQDPLVRYKYFANPQAAISYNGQLDLCGYPAGTQSLCLQLLDNHGQWSSVVTRPVTVNAAGSLGMPTITASASTFCPGDVITFSATPQTGPGFATPTGYMWQIPTGNGWSALPSDSSSIVVTIGNVAGSVQAAATNLCGSGPLGVMQVNPPPAPDQVPFINGPLQACAGSEATYTVPEVPGLTYDWQINGGWSASGGPGPSITTVVGPANATISVVAQNACGMQAPPRVESIAVTMPPNAGMDGPLVICSNSSPVNLFIGLLGSPDPGGVWHHNGIPFSGFYNPVLDVPGVYTYTVNGMGPCPNGTASVTVSEPLAPSAGADATLALCSNAGVQVLTNALGGTPDANGSWSGPSNTNGLFDPATMSAGVYTYTVVGALPCANASATLTISIQQAPNAGTGGLLELCTGSAPVVLLSQLDGNPALNGTWTGPQGGPVLGIFTPGQDEEGTYTYTVQGSGACADAGAMLEVNVMDLELTGIDGPTSVALIDTLTYTALPGLADADSIVWTLPPGWGWAPEDADHYDAIAVLIPSVQAAAGDVCAKAFGGLCVGNEVCQYLMVGMSELVDVTAGPIIYPNPSDGGFIVHLPSELRSVHLRVINALGQEVASFQNRNGDFTLDLSILATGIYELHWMTDEQRGTESLIISR